MSLELETLLHEIDQVDGCKRTIGKIKRILSSMAGQRVYFSKYAMLRPIDIDTVRGMIESGISAGELRAAVKDRLGVSESTAYRLIIAARQQGKNQTDLFA